MTALPEGVYVLTHHDGESDEQLLADVTEALRGGAAMIQYRDKSRDAGRRLRQASRLAALCRTHDVPLIINDDPALCDESGADGVHLGRDDEDIADARRLLGDGAILGVSCYNEADRARRAVTAGADYLAFGSVFPSPTKPEAVHAPLALLEWAASETGRPVCAIGGIDTGNIGRLAAAGVGLAAVITAAWDGDPRENVAALTRAYRAAKVP